MILIALLLFSPVLANDFRQKAFAYTNNYGTSKRSLFDFADNLRQGEDATIALTRSDIDLALGGRIREEGFLFDKPLTLRSDYNDKYTFMRSKLNLDFKTRFGARTYKKPVVESHLRLTSFSVWDYENAYTPIIEHEVEFDSENFIKQGEISKHKHEGIAPLMYLDEGWISLDFQPLLENLPCPMTLKVGHFPFLVGRGISLGDYFDGAVEYLGFRTQGNPGNATQRPAGVLFTVDTDEHNSLELYYTTWRKRTHAPYFTRKGYKAKRLDVTDRDKPENLQRGTDADANLYAARYRYSTTLFKDTSIYLEPYITHLHEPELEVEFKADGKASVTSLGLMAEWASSNWTVNAEIAKQCGQIEMHAIDRNHTIIDDAYYQEFSADTTASALGSVKTGGRLDENTGFPAKYHSHVLLGVTPTEKPSEYLPYRAYIISDEYEKINANRSLNEQGKQIRDTDGSTYKSAKFLTGHAYDSYVFKTGIDYYDVSLGLIGTRPDGTLFNADMPFGGMRRFRKGYKLNLNGFMGLLDISYMSDDKKWKFGLAGAYISGDEYPYNTEEDKNYSGFIPMRDANYVGRHVTSFSVLYPRKIPRPVDMADTSLYAHNNSESVQNIAYVGTGLQHYPRADKSLMYELNTLFFWQPSAPYKWDTTGSRDFGAPKLNDIYKYIQDEKLIFSGAKTAERASNALGVEINGVAKWLPVPYCEFALRLGAFLPGKLYKDIAGTPNQNTIRFNKNGDPLYDALGSQTVLGGMLRMTYKF